MVIFSHLNFVNIIGKRGKGLQFEVRLVRRPIHFAFHSSDQILVDILLLHFMNSSENKNKINY